MKIKRRQLPAALAAGVTAMAETTESAKSGAWKFSELAAKRKATGRPWLQFFDNATMFAGVYAIDAGGEDKQQPHQQDEMYYVVSGSAKFRAGEEELAAEAGSILFVKAGVAHRFHSVTQPLEILVFFTKAKSS